MIQKNDQALCWNMIINRPEHEKINAYKKKHKLVDKPTALSHMLKKYK